MREQSIMCVSVSGNNCISFINGPFVVLVPVFLCFWCATAPSGRSGNYSYHAENKCFKFFLWASVKFSSHLLERLITLERFFLQLLLFVPLLTLTLFFSGCPWQVFSNPAQTHLLCCRRGLQRKDAWPHGKAEQCCQRLSITFLLVIWCLWPKIRILLSCRMTNSFGVFFWWKAQSLYRGRQRETTFVSYC